MNLLQAKNKTLQLIREYTNNGAIIGTGDNADYLKSINSLISDAQFEISEKRPIIEEYILPQPIKISARYKRYSLPNNFKGIVTVTKDDFEFKNFTVMNKEFLIPKEVEGEIILYFEKYPMFLDEATEDSYELEIDNDVQYITCYKAASHIIVDENIETSSILREEYKRLLYGIVPNDFIGQEQIEITYGGIL